MAKPAAPPTASDEQVRILLQRYNCPVPLHAVRTRFLGNIASPDPQASPMRIIESLWGGRLPEFGSIDEANELLGALMMGLWNRLSRHQERSAPFRLTRVEVPATLDGLARIALLRQEELEGFASGLFGENETLDLPQRAHEAMTVLSEVRSLAVATYDLATDLTKPSSAHEIAGTLGHLRKLTRIVEHEMHELVISCTRARRNALRGTTATWPVLH
jgi:hypothetical protein